MNAASSNSQESPRALQRFLPIALDSLDFCMLEMDLFLKNQGTPQPTLYRSTGLEFTPSDAARLVAQGFKHLYIRADHHVAYRRMLSHRLKSKVCDPALRHQERWKAVRSACDQMIRDVLLLPGRVEAVDAVGDVARAFSEWSRDETCGFSYMLDMSAHDFYTIGHMVNVGVGCGLLVKELKPGDAGLFSLMVQGGMLHDVGKRNIPESLLNKEGTLEPAEWDLIRNHPLLGFDELKKHASLPATVSIMARDHHERIDGKGYPRGLSGDSVDFAARVCAIVDVYDTVTAGREGRGPIAPADAIDTMREGRGTQFDAAIFDAWEAMVLRLVREDPERTIAQSAPGAVRPLSEMTPALPGAVTPAEQRPLDPTVGERRRHDRIQYHMRVTASFLRQGKALPVDLNAPFQLDALDLSRSGVGLKTPWPLSLGDLLCIQFPTTRGEPVVRYAKVVRVRSTRDDSWIAGCCFIEREDLGR